MRGPSTRGKVLVGSATRKPLILLAILTPHLITLSMRGRPATDASAVYVTIHKSTHGSQWSCFLFRQCPTLHVGCWCGTESSMWTHITLLSDDKCKVKNQQYTTATPYQCNARSVGQITHRRLVCTSYAYIACPTSLLLNGICGGLLFLGMWCNNSTCLHFLQFQDCRDRQTILQGLLKLLEVH